MHDPSPSSAPLPETVTADLELLDRVRALVAARPTTWETVLEHLGAPEPGSPCDRPGDYGYGVLTRYMSACGECTTVRAFAVVFDGGLARLRVTVEARVSTDFARGVVAAIWGGVTPGEGEAVTAYDQRDPRLEDAITAAIESSLGSTPRPVLPPELDVALDALLSPFAANGIRLGRIGYAGVELPDPFKPLLDAGRYDAVRCLLRSPVPAVRARAAVIIDGRDDLDEADRRAIAGVASEGLPISTAAGCAYTDLTAATMLERRRESAAWAVRSPNPTCFERLRDDPPWWALAMAVAFIAIITLSLTRS